MGAKDLNGHEKDMLIEALMYRVNPEQRAALMADLPTLYNKLVGKEIVRVVNVVTGNVMSAPIGDAPAA